MRYLSKKKHLLLLAVVITNKTIAFANYKPNIYIDTSYGMLSTTSHEYVYTSESSINKMSQLDWEVLGVPIIKSKIEYVLSNTFHISFNGWITIKPKQGSMNDYDWLNMNNLVTTNQSNWSHWSTHNNTSLRRANKVGITSSYKIFDYHGITLKSGIGYQASYYEYLAKGGIYSYNGRSGGFPDHMKTIRYKQYFSTPYIGLTSIITLNHVSLFSKLKYGLYVNGRDEDIHYSRNIKYFTKANNATFREAQLMVNYKIKNYIAVHISAELNNYQSGRGDTIIVDKDRTQDTHYNRGGLGNQAMIYSSGISYIF